MASASRLTQTYLGSEDAVEEMNRMQQLESARREQEALMSKMDADEMKISNKHFRTE
jgi:hypothetical protein